MNTPSKKPRISAWERLKAPLNDKRSSAYSLSARHMPSLLRKLQTRFTPANEGFVHEISVAQAANIRDHIRRNYTEFQVNWAHEQCVRDYQAANPYNKPRMDFDNGRVVENDAVEDALFDDSDKHPDKQWLDRISDESRMLKSEPEPKQDNALIPAGDYVTKPDHRRDIDSLRNFMAEGVTNLKRAIKDDINVIGAAVDQYVKHNDLIMNGLIERMDAVEKSKPIQIEIKRPDHAPILLPDLYHRHFPELLQICQAKLPGDAHLNVWVYGPAGTGKTTAAKQVANVLNLKFYTMGALETGYQILGYNDGNGQYVTTHFRECWEHGGVIALDECDSYTPSAALALNGALANGFCAFADKLVPRHKDCIIIAGANTTGLGGTIEYVGRMKQDAAFLDRFVMLDWPIDEALEDAICVSKGWLKIVRHVRTKVASNQIKGIMVTPRATLYGDAMIKSGSSLSLVLRTTLKKGMTNAQWDQVKPPSDWSI